MFKIGDIIEENGVRDFESRELHGKYKLLREDLNHWEAANVSTRVRGTIRKSSLKYFRISGKFERRKLKLC